MRDMMYYQHNEKKQLDLDATIISKVLKVKPDSKKKIILYFYNDKNPQEYAKEMVEIDTFKQQVYDTLRVEFEVYTIPLYNNNPRTNSMTMYMKNVFNVKDNLPTIVMFNSFHNIDNYISTEKFSTNKELQQLYKEIQFKK